MMGYVVPSAPGRTLYFTTMLHQGGPPQQTALGWKQRLQQLLRPAWVEHVKAHGIVDADVAMAAGLSANRWVQGGRRTGGWETRGGMSHFLGDLGAVPCCAHRWHCSSKPEYC